MKERFNGAHYYTLLHYFTLPGGLHLDPANRLAPPPFLRDRGSMRPFLKPCNVKNEKNKKIKNEK